MSIYVKETLRQVSFTFVLFIFRSIYIEEIF
ncbi:hypothetical protein protein [Bacillus cereus G9241]|nr:hypothetical protein protein [Bacillus cereus G9241]